MLWCFYILVSLTTASSSISSTSQVYDLLEKAVLNDNSTHCNNILEKHFFTESKDDAIWTYVMKETKDMLKKEFSIEDYITMDKDIKNLKTLWSYCKRQIDGVGCEEIFPVLHSTMKDFQWQSEGYMFFRKNYISIRIAFQSMVILMLSSMVKEPWVNTFTKTIQWLNTIQNEYDEMTKYLTLFPKKIEEERPFEIGIAEVCEVKRYMWKDFEQPGCEKRWDKSRISGNLSKRTLDTDVAVNNISNDDDDDGINNIEDGGNDESGNIEESSDQKNFFKVFTNPDWETVNLIGGRSNEYDVIMKARFTDFGGKKEIITGKEEFSIRENPKGEMIEKFIDITVDKRNVYVKEKLKEVDEYMRKTFNKVDKASKLFVTELKKKSAYWKEQINNDKHGHTA